MARTAKKKLKPSRTTLTPPPRKQRPESLTRREKEILELIWAGFKSKAIGHRLKISVRTVEVHRRSMMNKMRVSNTAQLLKTAILDGTITIR
jgi:DNA-binding NarL/FixJ family response regulator